MRDFEVCSNCVLIPQHFPSRVFVSSGKFFRTQKGAVADKPSSLVDTVALFRLLLVYMDVRLSKRNHFCIKGRK